MNLAYAALQKAPLTAALEYAHLGISVIPLTGKQPSNKWQIYQEKRASENEITWWDYFGKLNNVGIVCGHVSKLVVIDLDGLAAVDLFTGAFPGLLETFTVATGSGKGLHLYYRPALIPGTRRLTGLPEGNVELRSDGCYVVAPPSIHPYTGQLYRVDNPAPPLELENLNPVIEWMEAVQQHRRPTPPPPPPVKRSGFSVPLGNVKYPRAYALSALKKECDALRVVSEGNRNNRLNVAAYNLGQLVGMGWINRVEVESALLGVAAAIGQPQREALATITSGLDAGIADDRGQQWTRR